MRKKELFAQVLDFFERTMDATETELDFRNNFELVVAVVLSAQCTDKRINQVTPRLFQDFPTPEAMAQTTSEVIFDYIKSVSYPNNKAKQLTSLPGVGRKTANVVQAVAFHKAALAVDTHVFRVSHRLKLVPKHCTTPYSVEIELMKHIPESKVAAAHYWLLLHGRYTCLARKPLCHKCGLAHLCPSIGEFLKLK